MSEKYRAIKTLACECIIEERYAICDDGTPLYNRYDVEGYEDMYHAKAEAALLNIAYSAKQDGIEALEKSYDDADTN